MVSRHLLQSYLIAIVIVMAHAGSKAGKKGKKGSSGGRWSGNLRPDRWNPRDKWSSSKDSWSGSSKSKDKDDDDYDTSDSDDKKRKPMCTLANPVQEQYDIIIGTWTKAFLNNVNQEENFQRAVVWHANLVMEKFMDVVEGYDDDGKATLLGDLSLFSCVCPYLTLTFSACRL